MSRARNIKPGFFKNEVLAEMPFVYRVLFIGLWTHADREGRFEYRPRRIKAELFPYDELSVEDGIAALVDGGFLHVYEAAGKEFVQIVNWGKHQAPHHKEVGSVIPPPPGHLDRVCEGYFPLNNSIRQRIYARDGRVCRQCGATHGLSIDHITPITKGGNSNDENLQVLCLICNARKNNKIPSKADAKAMHKPCMDEAQAKQGAPCPTDSLIPDSLIPSEAIASGASAPGEPEQVKGVPAAAAADPIWHTGLAFLTRKGIPSEQARKFLGKLKREAGDIDAAALLADAEAQDITDPVPWLSAGAVTARERAKQRGSPSAPPMGKQMQGLMVLEAMKSGNRMAAGRGTERAAEDVLLVAGPDTRG